MAQPNGRWKDYLINPDDEPLRNVADTFARPGPRISTWRILCDMTVPLTAAVILGIATIGLMQGALTLIREQRYLLAFMVAVLAVVVVFLSSKQVHVAFRKAQAPFGRP